MIIFICNIWMKVSGNLIRQSMHSTQSIKSVFKGHSSQLLQKAQELAKQISSHISLLTQNYNSFSSSQFTNPPSKSNQTLASVFQILENVSTKLKQLFPSTGFPQHLPDSKDTSEETNSSNISDLLQEKQNKIRCLQNLMREQEKNFKNIQLKLLKNTKKLNQQLCQKEKQVKQLREIISEKEEQINSLTKINERKYRKIRELEEDVFDLESQLQNKKEDIENLKQCSFILEEKLSKMATEQSFHTEKQDDNFLPVEKDKSQMQIQTEQDLSVKERQLSQFLQSKENKYLQSIQRLTFELSEAYQRINQLTKGNNSQKISLAKQIIRKSRTTSTYFSRKT